MKTQLNIIFDEKRCGYWVKGHDFDFFLHFTEDEFSKKWLECDSPIWLRIPIENAVRPSIDYLETILVKELTPFFNLEDKC